MNTETEIKNDIELFDKMIGVDARQWCKARYLPAAIRITEILEPIGGPHTPIFPPTYPGAGNNPQYDLSGPEYDKNGEVIRYSHCVIDKVPSQANRMEPAFLSEKLKHLVPPVSVCLYSDKQEENAPTRTKSLLEVPHRIADFRIRCCPELVTKITNAISEFDRKGNALPLVKIAPTSLIFGFWDSRGQGFKHPRLLSARIDASQTRELRGHASYNGPYSLEEVLNIVGENNRNLVEKDKKKKSPASRAGAVNALDGPSPAGVLVDGEIKRVATISLTDICRFSCFKEKTDEVDTEITLTVRRYLLGLALLAEDFQRNSGSYRLRSGCELVVQHDGGPHFQLVGNRHDQYQDFLELIQNADRVLAVTEKAKNTLFPEGFTESDPSPFDPKELIKILKEASKQKDGEDNE